MPDNDETVLCACGCGQTRRRHDANGREPRYLPGHDRPAKGARPRNGALPGARNNTWKGGRGVASNGYVLVKRPGHHLADRRGSVYEPRRVAAQMLGRRLLPEEQTHHRDGNKTNNAPANLEVLASRRHHAAHHRVRDELRNPAEPNRLVACACGCGTSCLRDDSEGRPRRSVSGHNMVGGSHAR